MLCIMTRDARVVAEMHVGQAVQFSLAEAFAVDVVQADGDELISLLGMFPNIHQPPAETRVVRWFGDEARFIAANLNHI